MDDLTIEIPELVIDGDELTDERAIATEINRRSPEPLELDLVRAVAHAVATSTLEISTQEER